MLQYKTNIQKGVNIVCPGFEIDIVKHTNLHTNIDEYAIHLSPNINFNTDAISTDDIHVIFAVDVSSSMNQGLSSEISSESKINITKNTLIETIRFLYALVVKGKQVFISIVTFSSSSNVIYNRQELTYVEDAEEMCSTIRNIHAHGSTDLGSAIVEIQNISRDTKEDSLYKILISDGYINTGIIGVPEIKRDYANYFNATIGIGSENDYDTVLLQTLSMEDSERSCFDSSEMKDQIIDSVFTNINQIADNVSIESRNIVDMIINKEESDNRDYTIINRNIGFDSKCMFLLRQCKSKIRINEIQSSYLMSDGYNIVNPVILSCNDVKIGEIIVTISPIKDSSSYMRVTSELNHRVTIEIELNLNTNTEFRSNNMCKRFRNTQTFININNTLMSLNLEKPVDYIKTVAQDKIIQKELLKVDMLNKKIIALLKAIKNNGESQWNNYMSNVLCKFKSSIRPYIGGYGFSYITNNVAMYTPLRMSRSQSSRGSYAFSGRQVSMGFSQSVVNEKLSLDDIDDIDHISSTLPLPKPELQRFQVEPIAGIQVNYIPMLYPGANSPASLPAGTRNPINFI